MRFVGRGHPNVRATHAKTFELTPASDITQRATCVIAVDVRTADATPCAGPVTVTVRVGEGPPHVLNARANSAWLAGSTAVFRRSPLQLPDTYATCADTAAAELPRTLIAAARSADTTVTVDIEPALEAQPTLVLFAAEPSRRDDERLRAEATAARRIVVEDPEARKLVDLPTAGEATRTLVLATRELPGATVRDELADPGTRVETIGLPPQLAAAAASPSRAPLTIATDRPAQALRSAPARNRVLLRCPAADAGALVELAGQLRPNSMVVLTQQFVPPIRVLAGQHPSLPTQDVTYCCFAPSPDRPDDIDPKLLAAIRGLLDDGVATRAAARALAELAGISRRDAYDRVLKMNARPPG